MYMSKIRCDMHNKYVRKGEDNEAYTHKNIQTLFEGNRESVNALYIKEMIGDVLYYKVQSDVPPVISDKTQGLEIVSITDLDDYNFLKEFDYVNFVIVASPSRWIFDAEKQKRARRGLEHKDERINWMIRKLSDGGVSVGNIREHKLDSTVFYHGENKGEIFGYEYTGNFIVDDWDAFIKMVNKGIGPCKAYGMGMFVLS